MKRTEFLSARQEFKTMPAELFMEGNVVSISPEDTCRHAASQMTKGSFGSLPVVDDKNHFLGIVSEYDLLNLLKEDKILGEVPVSEVMTKEVKVVQADTPADDICELLQTWHLIRVPVVKDGRLVGIVARRDILFGYIKATAKYWP